MRLKPNESKLIVRENRPDIAVNVWNRTKKTRNVYYTSRGVEIHE